MLSFIFMKSHTLCLGRKYKMNLGKQVRRRLTRTNNRHQLPAAAAYIPVVCNVMFLSAAEINARAFDMRARGVACEIREKKTGQATKHHSL